jgi:hypothetical protein
MDWIESSLGHLYLKKNKACELGRNVHDTILNVAVFYDSFKKMWSMDIRQILNVMSKMYQAKAY